MNPFGATTALSRMPQTVATGAELVLIYEADSFFEGPTWDPQTASLYFTSWARPSTQVLRHNLSGQVDVWLDNSEGINGTFLSNKGRLLGAQVHRHRVVSYLLGQDTMVESILLAEDLTWHQPNDLCQSPDGDIYLTDPDFANRKTSAVYHLSVTGDLTKIINDMPLPNGLICALDGNMLYVADSHEKHWRIYPITNNGQVGEGRIFFDPETTDQSVPDGMSIDELGNLYLTGRGGVWVVNPLGKSLGLIPVPEFASNVTFGGKEGRTLFVTCNKKLYQLRMNIRGGHRSLHRYDDEIRGSTAPR